jgi:hypothetical protein
MNQPRKLKSRISLKSLSPARQELIVCMHEFQYGTINQLPVVDGEPNLKLAKVVRRRSLNRNAVARPTSKNFILKLAHLELLGSLDQIGSGIIEMVTFREGLPCELETSGT